MQLPDCFCRLMLMTLSLLVTLVLCGCGDSGGGGGDVVDDVDMGGGSGALEGVVTTASGAPPTGAVVTVAGMDVTVDDTGSYAFADVPAGSQTVSASLTGFQAFSTQATITDGQTTTLDIELQ